MIRMATRHQFINNEKNGLETSILTPPRLVVLTKSSNVKFFYILQAQKFRTSLILINTDDDVDMPKEKLLEYFAPLPKPLWLKLSINFCGPVPIDEYLLVLVAGFSQ